MGNKNSHIHLLIETDLKNKLKSLAKNQGITFSEYCRVKLREESRLLKIEKMIERLLINHSKFDLNYLAFERLKVCRAKNNIINFKTIWSKLCTNFSITKEDCWRLLRDFEREGKIRFVKGHGIEIRKREEV